MTSDVPTKYECIVSSEGPPVWLNGPPPGWVEIPDAARIRAAERARVLDEVQAALRDDCGFVNWRNVHTDNAGGSLAITARYLRDTVGAGGEG